MFCRQNGSGNTLACTIRYIKITSQRRGRRQGAAPRAECGVSAAAQGAACPFCPPAINDVRFGGISRAAELQKNCSKCAFSLTSVCRRGAGQHPCQPRTPPYPPAVLFRHQSCLLILSRSPTRVALFIQHTTKRHLAALSSEQLVFPGFHGIFGSAASPQRPQIWAR